jgi:hypothetical protein
MPRGYRGIFLAALVASTFVAGGLGAYTTALHLSHGPHRPPASDKTERQSVKSEQNSNSSAARNEYRAKEEGGCLAGADLRKSELCAQWKAADAAVKSALWTERGVYVGFAGIVVGFLTLFAAGFAAFYAKKAAIETEKGAMAALNAVSETKEANNIAREAIGADRAWLCPIAPAHGKIHNARVFSKSIKDGLFINMQWRNVGNSPAISVNSKTTFKIVKIREHIPQFNIEFPILSEAICAQGASFTTNTIYLDDHQTIQIMSGSYKVILYSKTVYRDVFNNKGITRFSETCVSIVYLGGSATTDGKVSENWDITVVGPQNTAT